MAGPTLVQSNVAVAGSSFTSFPCSFLSNVTPGNFLIAYCCAQGARVITGCSDNVNGSWNIDTFNQARAAIAICSFPFAFNGQGAPQAVTVTFTQSGAANNNMALLIEEWSGVGYCAQPDKTPTGSTNGGASSTTTGSVTNPGGLSQASGELIVACLGMNADPGTTTTFAVAGPFTPSPASPGRNSTNGIAAGYLLSTSTSAQTATFNWTNALQWGASIAVYYPSWGAGIGWMS